MPVFLCLQGHDAWCRATVQPIMVMSSVAIRASVLLLVILAAAGQEAKEHWSVRLLKAANLTMEDLPPELQQSLPQGPDNPLSVEEILECQRENLHHVHRLTGVRLEQPFQRSDLNEHPIVAEVAGDIFTPDYCQNAVAYLRRIDTPQKTPDDWILWDESKQGAYPDAAGTKKIDDGNYHKKRQLQASVPGVPTFSPALQVDKDPRNTSFTLDELGKGYPSMTGVGVGFTYNYTYDQYGVDPRKTGYYLSFVIVPVKTAVYIAEIFKVWTANFGDIVCSAPLPFNIACIIGTVTKTGAKFAMAALKVTLSAVNNVKNSFDLLFNGLNGVKTKQSFDNAKKAIKNQEREVAQLQYITGAIEDTSANLVVADKGIVTLHTNVLDKLDIVGTELDVLKGKLLQWNNVLGINLVDLINREGSALVLTLANSELRMTNILINTIFDKLSIDGANRPNRLPVPDVFNSSFGLVKPITTASVRRLLSKVDTASSISSIEAAPMTETEEEGEEQHEMDEEELYRKYHRALQFNAQASFPASSYRWGYGCDGNDNNNDGQVDEPAEDVIKPIIKVAQAYGNRNNWFINADVARSYIIRSVQAFDDCGVATLSNATLVGTCKDASVTVLATDASKNTATATVPIFYDNEPPKVDFSLQPDKAAFEFQSTGLKPSLFLVNLGLTNLNITDNCGNDVFLKINVYSDEKPITVSSPAQAALLRSYDSNNGNVLVGWNVLVLPKAAITCKDTACVVANGRVFYVVVCAVDAAGQEACAEQQIGVAIGPGADKPKPVGDGKLFLLAHDSGYYLRPPLDEIGALTGSTFNF